MLLYALLTVAAAARLLMQMAALPPYAGLDEIYHVARLAFVREEGRNPRIDERSIPPYLERSVIGDPQASAAFGVIGERWPDVVHKRPVIVDRRLLPSDLKPYVRSNYQAQHPSLYYSLIGPLVPVSTPMTELREWRFFSVIFAIVVVLATAVIAERWFGPVGILAGAVVLSVPTWLTLLVRAGNDGLACALLAVAAAISTSAPRRNISIAGEAIAWAAAIATKLYTWPIVLVLPFLWYWQRARRARIAVVVIACATSAALTVADLASRTNNPVGSVAFDAVKKASNPPSIHIFEMIKVTIASAAWSSGQHWDALRPFAILLFAGPVVVAMWLAAGRSLLATRSDLKDPTIIALIVLQAFAIAQFINALAFIRQAHAAGLALPQGGKEGWYWYCVVPLVVPGLLAPAILRFRALAWWIVAWDLLITEVALFHDFSGASSPAHPTFLFRWGPLHLPFTAHLHGIAVGPFVGAIVVLRLVHLAAFFAIDALSRRVEDRRIAA